MNIEISKPSLKLIYLVIIGMPISLGVFTNSSSFNIAISDFLIVFLFLSSVLFLKYHRDFFTNKQLDFIKKSILVILLFFILILMSICQYIFFSNLSMSFFLDGLMDCFKIFICLIYAFTFIVCILYCYNLGKIGSIINACKISLFILSITCIFGYFLHYFGVDTPFIQHGYRARGTMYDTNLSACFILTFICFPLIDFYQNKKKSSIFLLIVSLLALICTCSKAGILIFVAEFAIMLIMLFIFRFDYFIKIVPFVIILVCIFFVVSNNTNIFNSFFNRLSELDSSSISRVTTGRSSLWDMAFDILFNREAKNTLTGIGIGMFRPYLSSYYPNDVNLVVHNTFISLWLETGLLTFLLVVSLFLYLIIMILKKCWQTRELSSFALLFSLIALIMYMNSVNMQNNRFVYFFVIMSFISVYNYKMQLCSNVQTMKGMDINLSM